MALKPITDNTIHLKSKHEVEIMREAGRVVALTALELKRVEQPGMTTKDLDRIAGEQRHAFVATNSTPGQQGGDLPGQPLQLAIADGAAVVDGGDISLIRITLRRAVDPVSKQLWSKRGFVHHVTSTGDRHREGCFA